MQVNTQPHYFSSNYNGIHLRKIYLFPFQVMWMKILHWLYGHAIT